MKKKPVIAVVGSYNTDITLNVPRLPANGETIIGSGMKLNPGGKGSNQAVAAFRSGSDVSFIAKVGCDGMENVGFALYEKLGFDTSCIIRDANTGTGTAAIEVDGETGENRIIVIPGANAALTADEVRSFSGRITASDILLIQLETSYDSIKEAVKTAKENGVRIVLNPAPFSPAVFDLISDAYLITPNETEAELIAPGHNGDIRAIAVDIISMGCRNVIVTCGAQGSYYRGEYGEFSVPAKKVRAVDTTGAGDAYNGALCTALAEGKSIKDAMIFAGAYASLSVTRHGAAPSMPTRAEAEEFLKS